MSLKCYSDTIEERQRFIHISVKIPETVRVYHLHVPKGTILKEISNTMSRLLNLDPLRTTFVFYLGREVLSPSSTLLQNKIRDGTTLVASMLTTGYSKPKMTTFYKSITKSKSFDKSASLKGFDNTSKPDYRLTTGTDMLGLNLFGTCQNERCIAYDKLVTFHIGMGVFSLMDLLNNTKCIPCRRSVKISKVSLTNCFWKVEGNYYDSNGFFNTKYMKEYCKAEGTESELFYQKLRETKFINPKVTVKAL